MRNLKDRMYEYYKKELKQRGERTLALLLSASMVISPLCGTSITASADEPRQPQEQTSTQVQTYVDPIDNVINRVADPDTMTDGQSEQRSMNDGQSEHESMYSVEHGEPTDLGENESRESETAASDEMEPINDGTEILNNMSPATSSNAGKNNEKGVGMDSGVDFGILDDNSVVSPSNATIPNKYACELDDGTVVTVVLDEGTELPEGADFHAELLDEDNPRTTKVMETLRKAMGLTEEKPMNFFPCDIYFTDDNGDRIDIEGGMSMTVTFGSRFADIDWGNEVYCLDADDNVEKLDAEWDNETIDLEDGGTDDVTKSGLDNAAIGQDDGNAESVKSDLDKAVFALDDVGSADATVSGLNADGTDDVTESDLDIDEIGLEDDDTADEPESEQANDVNDLNVDRTAEMTESDRIEDSDSLTFAINSLSMTGLASNPVADDQSSYISIKWGTAYAPSDNKSIDGIPTNDGCTWDLSATPYRLLTVPVDINIASSQEVVITLDLCIDSTNDNIRSGYPDVECNTSAISKDTCDIQRDDQTKKITLTFSPGNKTIRLPYAFDCWRVVSGKEFSVHFTYKDGALDPIEGDLKGKIVTGLDLKIINDYNPGDDYYYYENGRGTGFSLSEFGGADYVTSYILNWSPVYDTYFNFKENDFNIEKESYIYDIAPFLVRPMGQQPYDISGTVTLDKGGEVLGGVYMMNSTAGSTAPWAKLNVDKNGIPGEDGSKAYKFSLNHNAKFDGPPVADNGGIPELWDKVVTGNLTDGVDNKLYTLYFLVRYKIVDLTENPVKDTTHNKPNTPVYTTKAKLSLTHTGVDQDETGKKIEQTQTQDQTLYHGPTTDSQIYDAYYTYFVKNQQDALSNLDKVSKAAIEFQADFFCYNEARSGFDSDNHDTYRLEAVIDLLYLTGERPYEKSAQLEKGDYRLNKFSLSLVDAPGNWSQTWYYEEHNKEDPSDDEVWKEQRPNVGWPEETWKGPNSEVTYSPIKVYGSKSHDDEWNLIKEFTVNDIWAREKGRDVNDSRFKDEDQSYTNQFEIKDEDYVRLKVVYDSRWTTALRIRYQVEFLPGILDNHSVLKNVDQHGLTVWFNYFGYTKANSDTGQDENDWYADTENMACNGYVHSDADLTFKWPGEKDARGDKGSIEQARKYDNEQAKKLKFKKNFNDNENDINRTDTTYSLRDYVRIMLGRMYDQGGMLITQALYSNGIIVGNNANSTDPDAGSFCRRNKARNVSEIVYSISGGVTNGALSQESLKEVIAGADDNSPFKSLKMRYYVLLPVGFKLNTHPFSDPSDLHDTATEDNFLSRMPSFYVNQTKTIGEDNVPTSNSNIPAWNGISDYGYLSEMHWNIDGDVRVNRELSDDLDKGRLVVFDRELNSSIGGSGVGEVFNLHGATETYFWGRGLSFSAVPIDGTGKIPAGDYTTEVWCQYLDKDGKALSLNEFVKDADIPKDMHADVLNHSLPKGAPSVDGDTLLYIPSTFNNSMGIANSDARITLVRKSEEDQASPMIKFGEDYAYKLEYELYDNKSEAMILWTNIEQNKAADDDDDELHYTGIVTGVDLNGLSEAVKKKVKVYVRYDWFDASTYTTKDENILSANPEWLNRDKGWSQVTDLENFENWAWVKAVAFYFEDQEFSIWNTQSDVNPAAVQIDSAGDETSASGSLTSVSVRVNMKLPDKKEYLKWYLKQEVYRKNLEFKMQQEHDYQPPYIKYLLEEDSPTYQEYLNRQGYLQPMYLNFEVKEKYKGYLQQIGKNTYLDCLEDDYWKYLTNLLKYLLPDVYQKFIEQADKGEIIFKADSPLLYSDLEYDEDLRSVPKCAPSKAPVSVEASVVPSQISIIKELMPADGAKLNDKDKNTEFEFTIKLNPEASKLWWPISPTYIIEQTQESSEGNNQFNVVGKLKGTLPAYQPGGGDKNSDSYVTATGNNTWIFKLKGGQTFSINDITEGTEYTVTEKPTDQFSSTARPGAYANLSGLAFGKQGDGSAYITGTAVAGDGSVNEVKFTNTKQPTASLSVEKKVCDENGQELTGNTQAFTFNIELTMPDGISKLKLIQEGETKGFYSSVSITDPKTGKSMGTNIELSKVQDTKLAKYKGTFTLKHGQTWTISDLPIGTEYAVTEEEDKESDKYTTTVGVIGGTIDTPEGGVTSSGYKALGKLRMPTPAQDDGTNDSTVTFTNTLKEYSVPVPFNFQATKNFVGDQPEAGQFTFYLQAKGVTYPGAESDIQAIAADVNGTNGQPLPTPDPVIPPTEPELPPNTVLQRNDGSGLVNFGEVTYTRPGVYTYEMWEVAGTDKNITYDDTKYIITVTIVRDSDVNAVNALKVDNIKYKFVINNIEYDAPNLQGDRLPVFKNAVRPGLIVRKTVTGNLGDKNKDWHFTVKLSDTTLNGTYGEMTFTNGVAEFTLKHGESKIASKLPAGITYTVTEAEANTEGYTTTATGDTGIIPKEDMAIAEFVNRKSDGRNLKVSKTVTGSGSKSKEFSFTVTFDPELDLEDIKDKVRKTESNGNTGQVTFDDAGNGQDSHADVTFKEDASLGKNVLKFKLKDSENLRISDLPVGTEYTVTEAEANRDGYRTWLRAADGTRIELPSEGANGKIPENDTAEVNFVNHKPEPDRPDRPDDHDDPDRPYNPGNPPVTPPSTPGTPGTPSTPPMDWDSPLTPINPRTPGGPPRTGDDSNMSLWLALMAVSLAGAAVTLFFHRKKKDERKSNNN